MTSNIAVQLISTLSNAQVKERWQKVAQRLRAELGDDLYTSWFARMDAEELGNAQLTVSVPTRFLRSWIENHYLSKLHKIAESEFGTLDSVQVRVRIQGEASRAASAAQAEIQRASAHNQNATLRSPSRFKVFLILSAVQILTRAKLLTVSSLAHLTSSHMLRRCGLQMQFQVRL